MDSEKLIEHLKAKDFERDYDCTPFECGVFGLLDDAATALSTLQAENKRLQEMYQKEKAVCHATQAELEQVKRERDAAVSDLTFVVNQYRLETTGIDLCGLCEYDLPPVGENGQTAECPGFYVNDCFKWRGPEEG